MINFYIEPDYNVRSPERDFGNAGIDFFIPTYSDTFVAAFTEKNNPKNASLHINEKNKDDNRCDFIRIEPHGRVNIPSGIRSRICVNIALEAQNKSGIATKFGLVYGATTVDASYQGIIHLSLINTTNEPVELPLGMKIIQFIPRLIDISEIEICNNMSLEEFYRDFEHTNRKEGAFGSTGI